MILIVKFTVHFDLLVILNLLFCELFLDYIAFSVESEHALLTETDHKVVIVGKVDLAVKVGP